MERLSLALWDLLRNADDRPVKPQIPNLKPQTPNPKPQTPDPKPQPPNPKPQTPNPKPQTLNTKHQQASHHVSLASDASLLNFEE